MAFGEAQDSLSALSEGRICLQEPLMPGCVLGNGLSALVDEGASLPDALRGALHEHTEVRVFSFVVIHRKGIFVGGIKRHATLLSLVVPDNRVSISQNINVLNRLEELNEPGL